MCSMAHKDLSYRNTLRFILRVLDDDQHKMAVSSQYSTTEFSVNSLAMLRCEETAHIAATLIRHNGQSAKVYCHISSVS